MKFTLGNNVLNFEAPAQYPSIEPIEKVQTVDRAADGTLQVENFRVAIKSRVLNFEEMSRNDYEALRNWFDVICDGAAEPFWFTDENSQQSKVQLVTNTFSFQQNFFELYYGSLTLEFVK